MRRGHHWFSVATGCRAFLQVRQQKVNYCTFKCSNAICQPKTKHIINCPSSLTLRKQPPPQRCSWASPDISRFPSVMQNHLNRKPRGSHCQPDPTGTAHQKQEWKEGKRMEREEQQNPQVQGHCSAWVTRGSEGRTSQTGRPSSPQTRLQQKPVTLRKIEEH